MKEMKGTPPFKNLIDTQAYISSIGSLKGGIFILQNNMKRLMKDCCLGTQMPYSYAPVTELPLPEGYVPFYVNYLGRHGGRYLNDPESAEWLVTILQCAYERRGLTLRGLELLSKIVSILEIYHDHYSNLSKEGTKMIQGIAHRMYLNYPQVFGKRIDAVATYQDRTIQSRNVFLEELERFINPVNVYMHTNGKIDPKLRFYELNEEYLSYKEERAWKNKVVYSEPKYNMSAKILERIFNRQWIRQNCLNQEEKNRFASELYQLYANQFDMNGVISLGYYFTPQEKYHYWEHNNLKQYFEMGPGAVGECITTNIAFGLLMDFLKTSEAAILTRNQSADLRFAHAETIIPFASLLGLHGMCEQTLSPFKVSILWKNYLVAPLGANLQWIFYDQKLKSGNREQNVLVQQKYNETSVPFPIPTTQYPYYHWVDVKAYYQDLINGLYLPRGKSLLEQVRDYQT